MDEIKSVPVSDIKRVLDEHFPTVVVKDWFGVELVIRRKLTLSAAVDFVGRVVDACFSNDGMFDPRVREMAFRMSVIQLYSNVDLPESSDEIYDILYGSDLYYTICSEIDQEQLDDIKASIDSAIDYNLDMDAMHLHAGVDRLVSILNTVGDLADGISADDIKNLAAAVSGGSFDTDKLIASYLGQRFSGGVEEVTE